MAIPDFLRVVVRDEPPASDRDLAEEAVLALDTSMLTSYDYSLEKFKANMRAQVPIILGLFSGEGGHFTLYRPGHEPEVAPLVPMVYRLAKSIGHSTMGIYQILVPHLGDPAANRSWCAQLQMCRTQHETALDTLGALDISTDVRTVFHEILKRNLAFIDAALGAGTYTFEELEAYIRDCVPYSVKTIPIGTAAQVGHWMQVLEDWKKRLGKDWERTYAVSNTLYVARQNNILFTILAQFMGTEAMGDRLLLIETPEFETTPDKMLDVLGRIVADRALGMVFFRNYFLMDVELLGGGARGAIEREMTKRGLTPVLPTLAPFRSNDWPFKTDPSKGTGPARLEDVK